jgi:hypothetical protein
MIPALFFKKSVTALAAFFLLNAAALSYLPAVHGALHAHEESCPESRAADSKDLCSAQNHLSADLSSDPVPDLEVLRLPETAVPSRQKRVVFFADFSASPRAPPVAPVLP